MWTPVAHHASSHTKNFQETISAALLSSQKGGGALLCKHGLPFVQSRWISTHSSWPPRGCSKLDLQMGYSPQHREETTQFMPAGNADVRRPPETESCYPCKAKPCVHGQRGRAVVLPAAGTALPSRVNFRDRMC